MLSQTCRHRKRLYRHISMRHEQTPTQPSSGSIRSFVTSLARKLRHRLVPTLSLALTLFLTLALLGCSTPPAQTSLLTPPPGAMQKAKPLPQLPATISVADLIKEEVRLTGMYHDLASRHNELVNWVKRVTEEHNRRVGAGE